MHNTHHIVYLEAVASRGADFTVPTVFGEPCVIVAVRSGRSEQDICRTILFLLAHNKVDLRQQVCVFV